MRGLETSTLKTITLNDILENKIEEFEVPGIGPVKIRCPTNGEKLEARIFASKLPGFDTMNITEQNTEIAKMVALKMLIEPKLSIEDYLKGNDLKTTLILDTVSMWYATKMKLLNDKRQDLMKSFLEQMKATSQ